MTGVLRIATWNINSIKAHLESFSLFCKEQDPDIVLLQEIKCQNHQFPYNEVSNLGYNSYVHGQKAYNGVAILSKKPLQDVAIDFPNNPRPDEARFIFMQHEKFGIGCVYVPNGHPVGSTKFNTKIQFIDSLRDFFSNLRVPYILGGDFNVAPYDVDSHAQLNYGLCCTSEERQSMWNFLDACGVDLWRAINPDTKEFSWWDYRGRSVERDVGMRIDMLISAQSMVDRVNACQMLKSYRTHIDKVTDHIPVMCDIELG